MVAWTFGELDSGNETPDPSFLDNLPGMDAARETKNGSREHLARETDRWLISDWVTTWKAEGARRHIKGRFHGGGVVLATSTEIDEQHGARKPRKTIWAVHAGTLLKCAPEQLRHPSERARQLANMEQAQKQRGRMKVWTDGCAKDSTKTCHRMDHQREGR